MMFFKFKTISRFNIILPESGIAIGREHPSHVLHNGFNSELNNLNPIVLPRELVVIPLLLQDLAKRSLKRDSRVLKEREESPFVEQIRARARPKSWARPFSRKAEIFKKRGGA